MDRESLAAYIDHTILKPGMTQEDALKIGREVKDNEFASACIPSSYLALLKDEFPSITLCTVISFPFGYDSTQSKINSCEASINEGADEVDLVVNISKVKSADWKYVENEFRLVNEFVHERGKISKWIFENSMLTQDEIVALCKICNETNTDFAKTSTGFGTHGAKLEDVKLMRANLHDSVKIKASGGIRSFEEALSYINAGVSRIGTSSGVKLISG